MEARARRNRPQAQPPGRALPSAVLLVGCLGALLAAVPCAPLLAQGLPAQGLPAQAVVTSARAAAPDVVGLYQELQVAQPNGFPTYELSRQNGKVTAKGGLLYGERARLAVTVDPARLYLRIDDAGDGEGATPFVTEIAVWLDSEGAPLLGLSERGVKAGVPFAGRVRFYSKASGRWNLVTDQVFPSLDERLCHTEPQELDESTAAWEGLGRAIALLPRTGIDIEVWCVAPSPDAGTGALVQWDRASGRFKAGRALSGPPPWPDRPGPR